MRMEFNKNILFFEKNISARFTYMVKKVV